MSNQNAIYDQFLSSSINFTDSINSNNFAYFYVLISFKFN